MTIKLNDDGQVINRLYCHKRLNDRAIDELIGICKGIVADQSVNKKEAEFLLFWLQQNIQYSTDEIVSMLYSRIHDFLVDDLLDQEEHQELISILNEFTGESSIGIPKPTTLPLDMPAPPIIFLKKTFCLTGKFAFGPRKICEGFVHSFAGTTVSDVSQKTDYLVIGTFCSSDWIHTSYGRKIEKAIDLKANGQDIAIISEHHWAQHLK